MVEPLNLQLGQAENSIVSSVCHKKDQSGEGVFTCLKKRIRPSVGFVLPGNPSLWGIMECFHIRLKSMYCFRKFGMTRM